MKKLQSINQELFKTLEKEECAKIFGGQNAVMSFATMPDSTMTSGKPAGQGDDGIDSSDDI